LTFLETLPDPKPQRFWTLHYWSAKVGLKTSEIESCDEIAARIGETAADGTQSSTEGTAEANIPLGSITWATSAAKTIATGAAKALFSRRLDTQTSTELPGLMPAAIGIFDSMTTGDRLSRTALANWLFVIN
jgi:hypothetical protein